MDPAFQPDGEAGHRRIPRSIRRLGISGRHQRTALVDQRGIGLVDYGETQPALHSIRRQTGQTITQIVTGELPVTAVGNIRPVGGSSPRRAQ